jgi:hypothetical protein
MELLLLSFTPHYTLSLHSLHSFQPFHSFLSFHLCMVRHTCALNLTHPRLASVGDSRLGATVVKR